MKRRKKKGSSLLMVIAIFGILTILGTSILGVVTANYKLRKEENERIKNLYGAESGIDEAYVVMCKVIDDAIAHGAKEADGLKSTKTLKVDAKSGEEKEEKLEVSLKDRNDKFKKEFVKYLTEKENGLESEVSRTYEINGSKAEIKGELESKAELEDKNFTITSTFEDENKKNRTVKVTYKIKIPQSYKDRFTVDGELSPIINYSMAADGDLRVKGSKDTIIKDDIWIKGNSESNRTVANKYKGGIEIEDSAVKFAGNIYTASNISIGLEGNAQVLHDSESRNIYAENILLGNTVNMDSKMGSVFSGEKANLYLANDLVVGCGDAKLEVDNLYAFNDRNVDVLGKEVRSSSSIIINSMTWPKDQAKLSVNSNAYVMGVAYINTDNRAYQTGESVAYKGNYKAYSIPIIDKDYSSNQFEYISPLMLITKDSKGNNLTLEDKAEHFKAYSDEFKLRTEGISLPSNTYAAGAYVNSKGKVLNDKKATNQLLEQKKAFVKEVYNMGIDGNYKEDDFYYGSAKKTVENQINWKGVDILIEEKGNLIDLKDSGIVVILNNNEEKTIDITSSEIKIDNQKVADYSKDRKYIVVSKGEINCNSKTGFNGMMVSMKDINITGTGQGIGLTLTEDEIKKDKNKDVLNLIFSLGDSFVESRAMTATDIIETGKWTLVK